MTSRQKLFKTVAQLSPRLPAFRGRNRLFLSLFNALGLGREHTPVEATLREPVPYRVRLDLHSWLQRLAFLSGGYEPDTVRLLLRLRGDSGGYLLDIGANVGLISIPFALLTGSPVYAFEAAEANFRALQTNAALNGVTLNAFRALLGDEERAVQFGVEGDGTGTGTGNVVTWEGEATQTLRTRRLDDFPLPEGCAVIKVDTDGYDLFVLRGARELLTRDRPVVFGEFAAKCLAWHGQGVEDVRAFAASLGYETWARVGTSWRFEPDFDPEAFTQDALLVPGEFKERFARLR